MRAWLTPNTLPSGVSRGALFIPDDPAYLEAVYGALLLLAEAENWELFGVVTPDQTAALFFQTLSDFIDGRGHVLDTGDIFFSAVSTTPVDCLACEGQEVAQADFPQLYDLIGTSFGPANGGNFTLPDLRGRFPLGVSTAHSLGSTGGNEQITLSTNQLPAHDHSLSDHTHIIDTGTTISVVSPGDFVAQSPEIIPGVTGAAGAGSTGSTGSGDPVDILPPFLTLRAFIVAR